LLNVVKGKTPSLVFLGHMFMWCEDEQSEVAVPTKLKSR